MSDRDEIDQQREWLRRALDATGLKPSTLARRAGLSPSTVLRAIDGRHTLDRRSLAAIARATGLAEPFAIQAPARAGFAEADLAPYVAVGEAELPADQYEKRIASRVMDLAGLLPGDVATFDMGVAPHSGDIVEAQVERAGSAVTVLRRYEPPYLLTETSDAALRSANRPLLVDGTLVRIASVLMRMRRALR